MDNEAEKNKANEGTLTSSAQEAIGDAAKANVNAALEVAKSAVGSFVGALTGEQRKPRTAKRSSRRKKASSKHEAQGKALRWSQTVSCCGRSQSYDKISCQAAIRHTENWFCRYDSQIWKKGCDGENSPQVSSSEATHFESADLQSSWTFH
jgi:hypothetical protein